MIDLLSHSCYPVLQLLVCWISSPGKLESLLPLLLDHLSQLPRELVILLIPGIEHTKTLVHNLHVYSQ